jgi:hypothetical protein
MRHGTEKGATEQRHKLRKKREGSDSTVFFLELSGSESRWYILVLGWLRSWHANQAAQIIVWLHFALLVPSTKCHLKVTSYHSKINENKLEISHVGHVIQRPMLPSSP